MSSFLGPPRSAWLSKATRSVAVPRGFTLIELAIVIVLIAIIGGLSAARLGGGFGFWKEESFVRSFSELIVFLHHQAVVDQAFYRLEIDLDKNFYEVGVLRVEEEENDELADYGTSFGILSLELAAFLNPSVGESQTFIPPPTFPSLAEKVYPPEGVVLEDVRTMRGDESEGPAYILFSPRGFSEFAVIHFTLSDGTKITILVNPFTGNTEIFRGHEFQHFEWTYGRDTK